MSRLFAPFFLFLILCSFASQRKSPNNVSTSRKKQTHCGTNWGGCCKCCNGRDGRDGKDGRDGRDGIFGYGMKGEKGEQGIKGNNGMKGEKGEQGIKGNNGMKGQKGESSSPGKNASGKISFGDTSEKCIGSIAGTVRYKNAQKTLQLCDGSAWLPLVTAGKGLTSNNPGRHCLDILNSGQSQGSGIYWIDPNGRSTDDSFQTFCDMETERGGWTLVATKVSPSFLFIKSAFSPVAAKTKNTDAASHIHPSMGDWDEIMFRFADVNNIRVIYNRKAGAPNVNKAEFDKFLMGKSLYRRKDIYGFYKYSPSDSKRNPKGGYFTIKGFYFGSNAGISEGHESSDKWLNLWNHVDPHGNNYIYSDNSKASGTKCIAGYCYLRKPVWVMVR